MRGVRYWAGLLGLIIAFGAAAQQQVLAPSEALACLTPPPDQRSAPKYPQQSFDRKEGATVLVEVEFNAPDLEPKVTVRYGDDQRDFVEAVLDHVRKYRVPCLKADQIARLRQEFAFVPTDNRRVRWLEPVDADNARRSRLADCIRSSLAGTKPDYPAWALRKNVQGTVVLRLTFDTAQGPPVIKVLDDAMSSMLTSAASDFARGLRMPCHDGARISVTHYYTFRIAGGERTVLKDMSLVAMLPYFKGIRQANVYFDSNDMGCPFDLRLRLNQPYGPNNVGEVGESNPQRRFLLDWLQRQQVDLPARALNDVLGQITTVTVPCMVLSLGTTSGGGASQ